MESWILEMAVQYGYWGVLGLLMVETIFPIIPSEAILLVAGALCAKAGLSIWMMALAATAGSLAGACVLYGAGRWLGMERVEKLTDTRLGHLMHLRPEHLQMAQNWFTRYQGYAVFLARFAPIVRSLISIPAGINKMSPAQFVLLSFVGSILWNGVLVAVGAWLGDSWQNALPLLKRYSMAIVVLAVAMGAGYLGWRRHKNQLQLAEEELEI